MSSFSGLAPWLRPYATALLQQFPRLTVTSTYRSYTAQLKLYRARARNPYPVAPPGKSKHQQRRAFDLAGPDADLRAAGAVWRGWGGTWSTSDVIHFEA